MGKPVIEVAPTLAAGKDYTVIAFGQLSGITPGLFGDDNRVPAAGKTRIRFIHGSPNAPAVEGTYVRRWVPDLTAVPAQYIHAPWRMPREVQRHSGCAVGADYPIPIVDHAVARQRALAVSRGILASRNEAALR